VNKKLLTMSLNIAVLGAVIYLAGCEKKTDASDTEQAATQAASKTCPPDCTKPCCAATDEAKTCPPDCTKACCTDKTASAALEQIVCPVMEGPINKELFTEHKGKKVYFCCAGCEDTFLKDPEKYIGKLPQFK
jgi:YHS domain-containing protein